MEVLRWVKEFCYNNNYITEKCCNCRKNVKVEKSSVKGEKWVPICGVGCYQSWLAKNPEISKVKK